MFQPAAAPPSPSPNSFRAIKLAATGSILIVHLLTATALGFHRDELLYLALGRHPDWGYWSNPPFVGWVGWLTQHTLGDGLWATRFMPALAAGALMWVVLGLVQRFAAPGQPSGPAGESEPARPSELLWALVLTAVAMLVSIAWLRAFSMLQPVPFDILFWAALSALLANCLARSVHFTRRDPRSGVVSAGLQPLDRTRWRAWLGLGLLTGLALLNKYTIVFWAITALGAVLLSPSRRVLLTPGPWLAAAVALLVFSPNLWWQYTHGFPVATHMRELSVHQLANVRPGDFLTGQLMFHGPGVFLWLPGLLYLLRAPHLRPYRALGLQLPLLLALLLVLHGKDYYTLGAYPVLFAAGGVALARWVRPVWARAGLLVVLVGLSLPLVPAGLPLLPAPALQRYTQWAVDALGAEGLARWEDGRQHPLPQDYADMLGWPELGALADRAVTAAGNRHACLVYAENYGQAAAVERFARQLHPPPVVSFADAYRLWAPDTLPPAVQTLVYINDELGDDIRDLFSDIRLVGQISDTLAREYGTTVWLCRSPQRDFPTFWAQRVKEVSGER